MEQAFHAHDVEAAAQRERWGDVEDAHNVDQRDVYKVLGAVTSLTAAERSDTDIY